MRVTISLLLLSLLPINLQTSCADEIVVNNVDELVAAVNRGEKGSRIILQKGVYKLTAPLHPQTGMSLVGAGQTKTIITHAESWKPSTSSLPDPEIKLDGLDVDAYLISLPRKANDIEIANLTLRGTAMHGAIFGFGNENLNIHHLTIEDFLWSGVRTFQMRDSKIHHCLFIDAGGKWKRGGIPGDKGGISGGALFTTWMQDCEIAHNRIIRKKKERRHAFFGIKGRGGRNVQIHHNTIEVNFSIEFPFEGNTNMNIGHNVLKGAVSIPKYAGGKVPKEGRTFHIHHNYFTTSYAIEFVRNGVEIDHNLFDFETNQDGGNLISGFGKAPAPGPAWFHNNLVSNPGRGVIWINEPYNHLVIRNNHIIARTTETPRTEGLFGFNAKSDFKTIEIVDNIVECQGQTRNLLRTKASYQATIKNNQLTNIGDVQLFQNLATKNKAGLEKPLKFKCGVDEELLVDGWKTSLTTKETR